MSYHKLLKKRDKYLKYEKKFKFAECPICLDTLEDTSTTSCGHAFHPACLERWLQVNNQCPMCRTSIGPPVVYESEYGYGSGYSTDRSDFDSDDDEGEEVILYGDLARRLEVPR
tara:strand:+ start:119 stop:460 length:342 start_codon:yes stop_codon:yes gene_type:complete